MSQTRRDIMAYLTAIGVGTIVIGSAAPVAFNKMFDTVGTSDELLISAGETHELTAQQHESYTAVEWLDDTAQLYWTENGSQIEIT